MRDLINCQPALYAYILSLLPNREDANDVLQDANLVMWRRSDEFVEGTNFLAWAYQIARYKVLAHHRDCHRDRHIFDDGLFAQLADQADRRARIPRGWRRCWKTASRNCPRTNASWCGSDTLPAARSGRWPSGSAGRPRP